MTRRASDYLFAGVVRLRVVGPQRFVRHFDSEYGERNLPPGGAPDPGSSAGQPDVLVAVGYGGKVQPVDGGAFIVGGHKTARWRVALGPPDARALRAQIAIAGGPSSFALSLVQGYFIEALVAVRLARNSHVALPGAAFARRGEATVLLGRSGSGKTTLSARLLAAGATVLSDDQVIIDAAGRAWRYPRRLRFYSDIRVTAPNAWTRLPPGTRSALVVRGVTERLTGGYVAPSLAVAPAQLGSTVADGPIPVRRLVAIGRSSETSELRITARPRAWAVEEAAAVLGAQRKRLSGSVRGAWEAALRAALAAERDTLAAALADVAACEVTVPAAWDARRAVEELEGFLRGG